MPIHDWTRVPTYVYRDFHTGWLVSLRRVLNAGVLPAGYYAMSEQVTRTMGPDVLALEMPGRTAGAVPAVVPGNPAAARLAVAEVPPSVSVTASAAPRKSTFRQKRLAIRHSSEDRLVAVIELVSPGNKSSRHPFASFVKKAVRAVELGINVLIIDPFPPGTRDPNGVHGAVWEELGGDPYSQPAAQPLTLAAYEARAAGPRCYVQPLAPGTALPDMPLFLEPGQYVPVPLERSYRDAFADVLPQHKALLEPPATSPSPT